MTSVFSLPFLTLFVYLFLLSASPCLSQGAASTINDLENQLFFRQYDGENDTARLSRIENYIFGQTYHDSVETRIARLKTITKSQLGSLRDFPAQRQKIVKELEQASKKGVGIKPYESVLSSIDHDIAIGLPAPQINKRLASLAHSIENQLNEMTAFRLGSASAPVSASEVKAWGQYAPYMAVVQSKIKHHWQPPQEPTSHSMVVVFKIAKSGQMSNLKINKSSGLLELDKSILKAVKVASPFAPLPSFCKEKEVDIQFTFDYKRSRYTKLAATKQTSNSSVKAPPNISNSFDMNTFVYVVRGGVSVGNVSPDFLEEVKGCIAAMPQKLLAELQYRGGRVCVTPRLFDKLPGYSYDQPRGYDDGLTGKNVEGLFNGTDAIICEYSAPRGDDLSLVKNQRAGHVLRHELGHAFDHYWDTISDTGEFKDIYMHELANMDFDQREGELAYFSQKTKAGPSECFAELFAIIIGGGDSSKVDTALRQYFPKCTQLIRQKLGI